MTMRRSFVLVTSIFLYATSSATRIHAQLPDADRIPAQLSLEDALRLARTHNPTYLQSSNDIEVANAAIRSAWGQFFPSLSTSMGVSGSQSHIETYLDPITQRPERLDDPESSHGSGLSQGISMGMTLFDGGRSFKTLAAQKTSARATDASIAVQTSTLEASVRQSFYLALRANQSIALSERLLASAQDRLTQTEALFRVAAKGQVDILGAQEDVAGQQLSLQTAKSDATKARLLLAQAIGIPSDGSFELVGAPPEVYDPATISVDALIDLAKRVNPTLKRQQLLVEVADKQASIAGSSRWPSLSASFNYNRSVSVPDYSAYRYLNPQNSFLSFSLGASLPLFSRFTTSGQIVTARAAEADARLQLTQTRLQLETDVRTAYIDFTNAYQSLKLAELRASLSNERLNLSQEQYRRGSITFSELQQMIDRAATAERDALNARFVWITSLSTLEQRIGAPVPK
jgi:outer membrane protein TolC